jgi:hypothetical protein
VFGACHRKALARFLGHETPVNPDSQIFFDAGIANEYIWEVRFRQALAHNPEYKDLQIKLEEECPVVWHTADGVPVTGRPDLMLWTKGDDPTPVVGYELKNIGAVKSAVSKYVEDKPAIDNLVQAAHYSLEHDCPFVLVYSYRGRGFVGGLGAWIARKHGKVHMLKEHPQNPYPSGKARPSEYSIEPYTIKEFRLGWENGNLYYLKENDERVDTPITADGIRRYYNAITEMRDNKDLFVRVSRLQLDGTPMPWDPCMNCELKEACDQFENDYDSWLDKVTLICEGE